MQPIVSPVCGARKQVSTHIGRQVLEDPDIATFRARSIVQNETDLDDTGETCSHERVSEKGMDLMVEAQSILRCCANIMNTYLGGYHQSLLVCGHA